MTRPVIGIASYLDRVRWDIWDTRAAVIQQGYVDGVTRGGGRAVVLPPDHIDADVVRRIDGLLLPAGPDLDPALYQQPRHPAAEDPHPDRDAAELALLSAARSRGLPVLGVCRGMQLLAVASGGTLHQHLPDVLGHDRHCARQGTMSYHGIRIVPASLAGRVLGQDRQVNSHHHQGVATTGTLRATGFADDGLIEVVEDPAAEFVLGVQWHPELQREHRLFAALVEAAARAHAGIGVNTATGDRAGGPALSIAVNRTLVADYFLAHLGYFSLLAILEEFAIRQGGASGDTVGLALFAYNASVGLSCVLVTRWLPRFSYRTIMGCCALLSATALAALPLTHSMAAIIALLLLAGLGTSTHGLLAMSLIAQITPDDAPRNRTYSRIQITVNVSAALGPAAAITLYGLHSKAPLFLTISLCYLMAAAVIFGRMPGSIRPVAADRRAPAGAAALRQVVALRRAVTEPAALRTILVTILGALLYAQLFSAFAVVVVHDLSGFLHTWIFTINALLIVALQAPVTAVIGRFLGRGRSPELFLLLGILLFAAAFLAFGSALRLGSAAVAGIVIFSLAETVFTPLVSTAFARLSSGSALAAFNLRQVSTTAGIMLGSLAGGSLFLTAARSGEMRLYWNVMAIGAIVAAGLITALRWRRADRAGGQGET